MLEISRWEDLGIGIDEDGSYLAISPCPDYGAVFPTEKATKLGLSGDQWKKLLRLLAESKSGNEASKENVMLAFGYRQTGTLAREDMEELRGDRGAMREIRTARHKLTTAIKDLARKLRDWVGAKEKEERPPLSVSDPATVRAGFVVRYLLRGSDGKLHFGKCS